jgi:hypothetical protein
LRHVFRLGFGTRPNDELELSLEGAADFKLFQAFIDFFPCHGLFRVTEVWATGFAESTSLQRRPWIRYFQPTMSRSSSAIPRSVAPSYRNWKAQASKQLQHRHGIAAAAIPEREWTRLYIRRFRSAEAADRAEREYRSTRPPDWVRGGGERLSRAHK